MRSPAWLGVCLSLAPAGAWAAAPSPRASPEAAADWPTMITQLRDRLDRAPGDAQVRHQLAIAYNNYAVELADAGKFSDSIRQAQEAVRLEPQDAQLQTNAALIHLKAALTAYQNQRLDEAKALTVSAIKTSPDRAEAYALLGEIEYHSQHLKEAKAAWERAAQLNPDLPTVQEKLKQVSQELPVESDFEKVSQAYFDIRFTEQLKRSTGYDIRDVLLRARREVGSDFSLWPTGKLVVLLYSAEQFRQLRQDTPEWVAGQFDGKIRVPLPGQGFDENAVIRTLYHEYTHAVIHEIAGSRVPTWLNEGLAEYEGWHNQTPPWLKLRQAVATNMLIPWDRLSANFSPGTSAAEVALAYEQSHSIARYLVERYGFWRMRRILKAVADGADLDETLTSELHLKLPKLQAAWRTWLDEQLQPR